MVEISPVRPVQAGGTEFTRFNALRHGILSRYTVLPWEDAKEYGTLLAALVAEHSPQVRRKNTLSKSWRASYGASVACA
jgi:hypothetical protein